MFRNEKYMLGTEFSYHMRPLVTNGVIAKKKKFLVGKLPEWSLCSFILGILLPQKNFKWYEKVSLKMTLTASIE